MNDFNNINLYAMKKSTLQVSIKSDITSDLFYELIRNIANQLITTALNLSSKTFCNNILKNTDIVDMRHVIVLNAYFQIANLYRYWQR